MNTYISQSRHIPENQPQEKDDYLPFVWEAEQIKKEYNWNKTETKLKNTVNLKKLR